FKRIDQPQVMGEIVAGVLLGPSLLGAISPEASDFLFSEEVLPFIEIVAQLGLVFFMFLIGLELDVRLIRGRGQAAVTVSQVSIVVPFLLGAAVALLIFPTLGSSSGEFVPFALFLGASMSITAFPVLARILTERGLYKTRLGAVTITCAAVNDLTAWCILAVVVAVSAAAGLGGAFLTIGLATVFIAFMIAVVRPLIARLAHYHEERGGLTGAMLSFIIIGILLSALATDRIGIHAIFGAFLFGAIMPQRSEFIHELLGKLEDFTVLFLLPLFFAYSGLRTEIGLLGTDVQLWLICGLLLTVAIVGKWGGSAVAAKFVGLGWRESNAIGILMNCRGLTELVILNIGLDLGVIPPALFAMLVIVALVTTFMTTPLLSAVYSREEQDRMIAEQAGGDADDGAQRAFTILMPLASMDHAYEQLHTALSIASEDASGVRVILLRVLRLPDSFLHSGPGHQEAQAAQALRDLRPLMEFVKGAGHDAVPLVIPSEHVAHTIIRVAEERQPDLILMSWRKPLFGRRLLDGTLGDVVEHADADVAIVVDPTGHGTMLGKGAEIVVPFGGGYHESAGLDLAMRLAQSSGAQLQLVGSTDASHDLGETAARTYERIGVWTTAVPSDDVAAALLERSRTADMVVLGVSDDWAHDRRTMGEVRETIAVRSTKPLMIVRRHGQRRTRGPRRWLQGQREWIEDSGEIPAVVAGDGVVDVRAEEAKSR
ncbi:MAG: cation:proton antiporter, partial [Actinomycetota bacterium]